MLKKWILLVWPFWTHLMALLGDLFRCAHKYWSDQNSKSIFLLLLNIKQPFWGWFQWAISGFLTEVWFYRMELTEVNKLNLPSRPCNEDPSYNFRSCLRKSISAKVLPRFSGRRKCHKNSFLIKAKEQDLWGFSSSGWLQDQVGHVEWSEHTSLCFCSPIQVEKFDIVFIW